MMSAINGLTPYNFLNPEDDGEGPQTLIPKAVKSKPKVPESTATSHKKVVKKPIIPEKVTGNGKSKPSHASDGPVDQRKSGTNAPPPRKGQKPSDEMKDERDAIPTGRDQNRAPPSISKRKDKNPRSQDATRQSETRQARSVSFLRKDSLKKEVAGKSTWGHPIDSQKEGEEGEDATSQRATGDGAPAAQRPRKPYRTGRPPTGQKPPYKRYNQPQGEENDGVESGKTEGDTIAAQGDDQQRLDEKNAAPARPTQLTLEQYMASKGSSNASLEEPVKKSKGLYVASDDSDWVGMTLSQPGTAKKDTEHKNGRKKPAVNKGRSHKVVLTFDEKQSSPHIPDSHGAFRLPRARVQGANQKEARRPRQEYGDGQEHGSRRYYGSKDSSSATVKNGNQPVQDQHQSSSAPESVEKKVDPREKFSIDFPALS